jgi:hypothetical protein
MKMVIEKLAPLGPLKGEADKGFVGTSGSPPQPYVAIGHVYLHD